MRLLASRCLVAMAAALPEDAAPHSPEARAPPVLGAPPPCAYAAAGALRERLNKPGRRGPRSAAQLARRCAQAVRRTVLPVLVKLLGCAAVREGVPGALAALLDSCPALHRAAADADAIGRLAAFLQDERCSAGLKARPGPARAAAPAGTRRRSQLISEHACHCAQERGVLPQDAACAVVITQGCGSLGRVQAAAAAGARRSARCARWARCAWTTRTTAGSWPRRACWRRSCARWTTRTRRRGPRAAWARAPRRAQSRCTPACERGRRRRGRRARAPRPRRCARRRAAACAACRAAWSRCTAAAWAPTWRRRYSAACGTPTRASRRRPPPRSATSSWTRRPRRRGARARRSAGARSSLQAHAN